MIVTTLFSMRRISFILMLFLLSVTGYAQKQQKWKAPKRPKPVKWNPPRPMAPEVIDVWRPYTINDNWFAEFYGGVSISMAENTSGHAFGRMCRPSIDLGIGRQTSYLWSTRFSFGYKTQRGWASEEVVATSSNGGDDYTYRIAAAYVDEMFNLSSVFLPYNEKRLVDVQLLLGVGINYTWGFDDKVKTWSQYGYLETSNDFLNLALRTGLQVQAKLSEGIDLVLQGTYNMVGDSFNGVKHSTRYAFDSYMEVSLGVRARLADHYGNHRYYKVRRREATSLRAEAPKIAALLDEERQKEIRQRETSETVAFGELMKTRISFYTDRTFVNDYQLENLRIVADFLKKHPEVNLVVKGYCGASVRSESADMQLAEKRVATVKKTLTRYYGVDESRIETWFDETARPPFPMRGEWIDGVVFLMVQRPLSTTEMP